MKRLRLKQQRELRQALFDIELALMGIERLEQTVELFENASPSTVIRLPITLKVLRQIVEALSECNRIVHSEDYRL